MHLFLCVICVLCLFLGYNIPRNKTAQLLRLLELGSKMQAPKIAMRRYAAFDKREQVLKGIEAALGSTNKHTKAPEGCGIERSSGSSRR